MNKRVFNGIFFTLCPLLTMLSAPAYSQVSQEEFDELKSTVEELKGENDKLDSSVKVLENADKVRSVLHVAGYASAGYTKPQGDDGGFGGILFAPIFHYSIDDRVMLESEVEFEVGEDGETEVNLEYLTIDFVLNDYAILVGGQFLSPIGQFRQNLHPSWINKLPDAPPGFGHGGAAPTSETGLQLRGGFKGLGINWNYAAFYGNGPTVDVEAENDGGDTEDLDIHDMETGGGVGEGYAWGGRLGILPLPRFEVGLSYEGGKANSSFEFLQGGIPEDIETTADFSIYGADFVLPVHNFIFRGEYVKRTLDAIKVGTLNTGKPEWSTGYVQGSYRFSGTHWELVTRYTDFDAPDKVEDQKQWAFGVNFLVTENAIVKAAYELNDGEQDSVTDDNRVMLQFAYGF